MSKHISFDFWNTFGVPNPYYAKARNQYLYDSFGITPQEYKVVKSELDNVAKRDGVAYTPLQAVAQLLPYNRYQKVSCKDVVWKLEELFNEYPPTVSDEVKQSLVEIAKGGHTFGIISNTNFIGGNTLHNFITQIIAELEIDSLKDSEEPIDISSSFVGGIYSGLAGYSKPSSGIFIMYRNHFTILQPWMHIGDDKVCDGGAVSAVNAHVGIISSQAEILEYVKGFINE